MIQSKQQAAIFSCDDKHISRQETLVSEEALQIIVNGEDFSLTMQTPGAEKALVRGLLFAEGISADEFASCEITRHENAAVIRVQLISQNIEISNQRRLSSTSSCGLCGKRNIDKLLSRLKMVDKNICVSTQLIENIFAEVSNQQALFEQTGGCHAASAATESGEILCVYEDIGRHNAVDKVIGHLLEKKQLEQAAILTVSGRVSFEIIQKCNRAGIPVLAAISAPSSLAVEMAQKSNTTLAAFCRRGKATFYSGFQRIVPSCETEQQKV